MKHRLLAVFSSLLILTSTGAKAGLIAYDSFSYTAGQTLNGANGGSGWSGSWLINGTGTNYTASTPLTYSGGSIVINGDTRTARIGSDATDLYARQFTPSQSGTLYFSFLFRLDSSTLNENDFINFMLNDDTVDDNSGGIGLLSTTTDFFGARVGGDNGGTTTSSSINMVANTTYLLVGKISKVSSTNYNRMDLFINPTSSIEPGSASATDSSGAGITSLSYFTLRGFNLDADDRFVFDELRIGDTFASVVPEPSAAMLLIGGVGFLFTLRKRFRTASQIRDETLS